MLKSFQTGESRTQFIGNAFVMATTLQMLLIVTSFNAFVALIAGCTGGFACL